MPPHRGDLDAPINIIEDDPLRWSTLYNMMEEEVNALNEMITEQLAKVFVSSSTAPHCEPVFFVKTGGECTGRKLRKLWLVVDYRELNRRSAKNKFPLPLIFQTLMALSKAKILTQLDLRACLNNIEIREGNEWKTAFKTPIDLFQYNVMPFELQNVPAVFQRFVNSILHYRFNHWTAYLTVSQGLQPRRKSEE